MLTYSTNSLCRPRQKRLSGELENAYLARGQNSQQAECLTLQLNEMTANYEQERLKREAAEARVEEVTVALHQAQNSTQEAVRNCDNLRKVIQLVSEQDRQTKKNLATRAHRLKDALVKQRGRVRNHQQQVFQQKVRMCKLQKQQQETVTQLLNQFEHMCAVNENKNSPSNRASMETRRITKDKKQVQQSNAVDNNNPVTPQRIDWPPRSAKDLENAYWLFQKQD
eukprot:TRINITY_DN200987_c0_g1_i1.p1 TRINITY_DN200987_c0_g1~~TRINITY_DN200987_c0_g1_i1.p1  ORF type:complete len:225 (-),score=13.71 TRINITY_DN200987_c0_g1_i1:27-701(-)